MKFLVSMLDKYIDIKKIKLNNLVDDLTSIGYEVENYSNEIDASQLKIAYVKKVEKHPNADTLNICTLETSNNKNLTIVTGAPNIKEKVYVIIAPVNTKVGNLDIKERDLRGVKSYGMICSLEEIGFNPNFLSEKDNLGVQLIQDKVKLSTKPNDLLSLSKGIIDIDILPNRNDVSNYKGLSRELSWKYNLPIKQIQKNKIEYSNIKVNNLKINLNKNISYLTIDGVKNVKISESIKSALNINKIESNDTLEDILNFAYLDKGIVLNGFDLDKAKKFEYAILESNKKVTHNNHKFNIKKGSLVIRNIENKDIILVAGLFTTDKYRINNDTEKTFVDASILNVEDTYDYTMEDKQYSKNIAIQHKGISLNTLKENVEEIVYSNLINLGLKVSALKTNIKEKKVQIKISDNYLEIKLGFLPKEKDFVNSLLKQNYKLIKKVKGEYIFEIPSYRVDINGPADLIEDYIRYDISVINKENNDDYLVSRYREEDKFFNINNKLSSSLINRGFYELITPMLIENKDFEIYKDIFYKKSIELNKNYNRKNNIIKQNLFSSMFNAYKYNYKNKERNISIFEIAEFDFEKEFDYHLATLSEINKIHDKINGNYVKYDFWTTKNMIFDELKKIGVENFDVIYNSDNKNKLKHPRNSLSIYSNKILIGEIFEINPYFLKLNKIKGNLVYSEINITKALDNSRSKNDSFDFVKSKDFISKDFTISFKLEENYHEQIVSKLKNLSNYKIEYIDIFQSENNSKNITFRVSVNKLKDPLDIKKLDEIKI